MSTGRSFIIGVERKRQLTYAIEITDHETIRQFSGKANRRPTDRDRCAVITALAQTGAIDVAKGPNKPWLVGINPDAVRTL